MHIFVSEIRQFKIFKLHFLHQQKNILTQLYWVFKRFFPRLLRPWFFCDYSNQIYNFYFPFYFAEGNFLGDVDTIYKLPPQTHQTIFFYYGMCLIINYYTCPLCPLSYTTLPLLKLSWRIAH